MLDNKINKLKYEYINYQTDFQFMPYALNMLYFERWYLLFFLQLSHMRIRELIIKHNV